MEPRKIVSVQAESWYSENFKDADGKSKNKI